MYSSIDLALAKMERQVRRYKDRITDHKPNMGASKRMRQMILREAADAAVQAEGPQHSGFNIVREGEFQAERMSVEQAIMQMNLLDREFHVFTNISTGDINVVHRLPDGVFGLIETHGHVDDTSA